MICYSFPTAAQSNRWLLGGDLVDISTSPGITTTINPNQYFTSSGWNMRHDHNNDLSFYIDDGIIYGANGTNSVLGTAFVNAASGTNYLSGYPEVCIVPVPGSCSKNYIIAAYPYNSGAVPGRNPRPAFIEIDMSLFNPQLQLYGVITGADPFGNVTATDIPNDESGIWVNHDVHCSEMHLALSKPMESGDRTLFISTCGELYTSVISAQGVGPASLLLNQTQFAPGVPNFGSSTVKSELELWQSTVDPAGNYIWRIAAPMGNNISYISIVEFDQNFTLSGPPVIIGPIVPQPNDNPLKGMEFSPDGNYLYVSTDDGVNLSCYDVQNGNTVSMPNINTATVFDFRYSMIETGKDQNLYLVCQECIVAGNVTTILGQISNPNSPSTAQFDANYLDIGYSHTAGLPGMFIITSGVGVELNVLPDQMDGEDYLQVYNTATAECCEYTTEFDVVNYQVLEGELWEPFNNPFNSAGTVFIQKNLEVLPGATLTLSGMTLSFGLEGMIIVHPGGTLNVDGSTLTGNPDCQTMWRGIEVWSDVSTLTEGELYIHPHPVSGTRSLIEQAIVGIAFSDDYYILSGLPVDGGYMEVEETDFKNNYISVSYGNHPINGQASTITNSHFNSTPNGLWYPYSGTNAYMFIYGYTIKASDFRLLGLNNLFDRAEMGIQLVETNDIQINAAIFENCTFGVVTLRSLTSGNASQTSISNNVFRNNYTCIQMVNGFQDEIVSNVFNSTYGSQDINFCGVVLDQASGFRVTDNIFNHHKYGVYVVNSGPNGGVIDANTLGNQFNECWRGIHTGGNNEALQIRCNTFNNVNQPAFEYSTAWYVGGDLPDQGQPGQLPELAAGNYFFRAGNRQELHSVLGNVLNSCTQAHNFCYFRNQSPASVIPNIATPNTIHEQVNGANQTSCTAREKLMDMAGNDATAAMLIIEEQENVALKAQYTLELSQWFKEQEQLDSLIGFLQEQQSAGANEQLYAEWMRRDSVEAAQVVLNDMYSSGIQEWIAFAEINQILLDLKGNSLSLLEMDSVQLDVITTYANSDLSISGQARAIKASIDNVIQTIPLESDTGTYRMAFSEQGEEEKSSLLILGNPLINQLDLEISSDLTKEELQLFIIDSQGRELISQRQAASSRISLLLSDWPSGKYIVSVKQGSRTIGTKSFCKF